MKITKSEVTARLALAYKRLAASSVRLGMMVARFATEDRRRKSLTLVTSPQPARKGGFSCAHVPHVRYLVPGWGCDRHLGRRGDRRTGPGAHMPNLLRCAGALFTNESLAWVGPVLAVFTRSRFRSRLVVEPGRRGCVAEPAHLPVVVFDETVPLALHERNLHFTRILPGSFLHCRRKTALCQLFSTAFGIRGPLSSSRTWQVGTGRRQARRFSLPSAPSSWRSDGYNEPGWHCA